MVAFSLDDKFKIWRNIKFYFPYRELTNQPKWRVAILTCMDCRITTNVFGIEDPGESIIIRNAGALLTPDSLRSLLIAIYDLKVNLIAVVGHTDCGGEMTKDQMNQLLNKISKKTGISSEKILQMLNVSSPTHALFGFNDVKIQIQRTIKTIREHPLVSQAEVEVVGYIYNTLDGSLVRSHSFQREI
ncbi:MAG: beta-class carbonic anhydrase [Candidatus Hodarchaeales archaeon]|jgi:carbonic anhydrase